MTEKKMGTVKLVSIADIFPVIKINQIRINSKFLYNTIDNTNSMACRFLFFQEQSGY